MMPAVICVADPDEARALRDDPQTPLDVRFLLTCCPRMTPAEAIDPKRLRYIIDLTRRQGKWSDWLATLSPMSGRRILRMPGIVNA